MEFPAEAKQKVAMPLPHGRIGPSDKSRRTGRRSLPGGRDDSGGAVEMTAGGGRDDSGGAVEMTAGIGRDDNRKWSKVGAPYPPEQTWQF